MIPQNSCVEIEILTSISCYQEDSALMSGISALIKTARETALPLYHMRTHEKMTTHESVRPNKTVNLPTL